jgi:hypothetical protein
MNELNEPFFDLDLKNVYPQIVENAFKKQVKELNESKELNENLFMQYLVNHKKSPVVIYRSPHTSNGTALLSEENPERSKIIKRALKNLKSVEGGGTTEVVKLKSGIKSNIIICRCEKILDKKFMRSLSISLNSETLLATIPDGNTMVVYSTKDLNFLKIFDVVRTTRGLFESAEIPVSELIYVVKNGEIDSDSACSTTKELETYVEANFKSKKPWWKFLK